MSDWSQGPGWWQASDGKWYPPQPPVTQPVYQWAAPPMVPARRTNAFAVAALVCGIVWFGGLASVLAIVFGIVALVDIRKNDHAGKGLAIAGLVLGGLGIVGSVLLFAVVGTVADRIGSTARVTITADQDTCWLATLGDSDSSRGALTQNGCGNASFELSRKLSHRVRVTKRTGAGPVTVLLADDDDQDEGTVEQNFQTVTVET